MNDLNQSDTWQKLIAFIGDYCQLSEKHLSKLTPDTRVVEDLKIDGDDGNEFIEAYAKYFNVNLSTFNPSLYFSDEGFDLVGLAKIFHFFLGKNKHIHGKLIMPLSKLEDAIKIGAWRDNITFKY